MIAPFNFKQFGSRIIMTNDLGRYQFVEKQEFEDLLNDRLDPDSLTYRQLEENFFVFNSSLEYFMERMKPELRSAKSYLFTATSLHIFVVTNYCNSNCIYCQANSNSRNSKKVMDNTVARKAVDFALQSPQKELTFEFQGGEPLSNFPIIREIVEYANSIKKDKVISYAIVSNLSLLTQEMIDFFKKHQITIATSLDGHKLLHNHNRPLADGEDAFEIQQRAMAKLSANQIGYGAIQTTTRTSLDYPEEIVDQYLELGLSSLFIRPLTPLGCAAASWQEIGYTVAEFIAFYKKALLYILKLNQQGISIKEGHAGIFLQKIINGYGVNYMELRSPCGAGVGQLAYYYDGNIFTCDEGRMLHEMHDSSFKMGNVTDMDYDSVMNSKLCKTVCKHSIIESIPKCADCAYLPYCGTCPVINYALEGDVISKTVANYRCELYGGMLDTLFELIQNDDYLNIFKEWVR